MTIKVDLQGAHIHEGEAPIAIGGVEWLEWLRDNPKSFRFECPREACIEGTAFIRVGTASFTAVRVGKYWQAHKKAQGTLRREHLGLDEKLTYGLMREVACKISSERYWEQRRAEQKGKIESHGDVAHETVVNSTSQTQEEIANLKALAEARGKERDQSQRIEQLQSENQVLKKQLFECSLQELNEYLAEVGGIPLDDKGKPKARYDQLAKFRAWLESRQNL